MPQVLLITSTIAPRVGGYQLSVTDSATRLQEYSTAFDHYLGLLDRTLVDHIVYADNSGYSLDSLRQQAAARGHQAQVEFLSFEQKAQEQDSRFYLEARLIEEARARSTRLPQAGGGRFWKVTGRYLIANIAPIIRNAPRDFDLYANFRNHPKHWIDYYLIAFRASCYDQILGPDLGHYRTTLSGESILRDRIETGLVGNLKIVPRILPTPRISAGRRGFDGKSYADPKETAKYLIRRAMSVIAPRIWI